MEKQSDKRMLLIAALVFGLVATAVSVRWLNTGEIVIRRGTRQEVQATTVGPVVGRIKSDHAMFYPVCAAWGLLGVSMLVLTPVAYFRNDEFLMKLSAYTCAAILPLGFATVAVAWLAG
jgi:hypothetical protein